MGGVGAALSGLRRDHLRKLHEPCTQFSQDARQFLGLISGEIAFGFRIEHAKQIDGKLRGRKINHHAASLGIPIGPKPTKCLRRKHPHNRPKVCRRKVVGVCVRLLTPLRIDLLELFPFRLCLCFPVAVDMQSWLGGRIAHGESIGLPVYLLRYALGVDRHASPLSLLECGFRSFLLVSVVVGLAVGGCRKLVDRPDTAIEVGASDFNAKAGQVTPSDVVQVPPSVFASPTVRSTSEVEQESGGEKVVTQKSVVETGSDGTEKTVATLAPTEDIRVKPGGRWTVDSLVGQINGRPVYASKFMQSIEDRILRIVAENPRAAAQRMIAQLVAERFEQYINNELIIAEAEGMLTSEMREGLFAWLQSVQEQTVSGYGGNRTEATQSLQDQFGMTMDQYLQERRDEALAQNLLSRRVRPRTIVSWRDVERQYSILEKEFDPSPIVTIGRIRVTESETAMLADVRARFARGESFVDVAKIAGMERDGVWRQDKLPPSGIAGLDLAEDIRKALAAAEQGKPTNEVKRGTSVYWFCVLAEEIIEARPIFDPTLQRRIRGGLQEQRARYEQFRYLASLRDRWVTNDIDQMTRRLTDIAIARYLPRE